jgi:carotenoid cleavage dioxygenase-like enzyme
VARPGSGGGHRVRPAGQLPAELSGRYLRNGPSPLDLDNPSYHRFLGAGMVHGVRLRDGKVE